MSYQRPVNLPCAIPGPSTQESASEWSSVELDGVRLPGVSDLSFEPQASDRSVMLPGKVAGRYEASCTFTVHSDAWDMLRSLFVADKPRWGQRGRKRLRKARLLARRLNELRSCQ